MTADWWSSIACSRSTCACTRSRCACVTRNVVERPASKRRVSTVTRCSASPWLARAASTRSAGALDLPARLPDGLHDRELQTLDALHCLLTLDLRARELRLFRALPHRIAHADAHAPRRKVLAEELAEHVAEAGALTSRSRCLGTGPCARAACRRIPPPRYDASSRTSGIFWLLNSAMFVSAFSSCWRAIDRSYRPSSAVAIACSTSTGALSLVGASMGSRWTCQNDDVGRVHDQPAQRVLGIPGGGLRANQVLLAIRDFGLRLDEIERRRLADADARLVLAHEILREIERALLHGDVRRERLVGPIRLLDARHASARPTA